jgi:tRNA A-37 threonylcarbamoyl transferase component Bud32
LEDVLAEYLMAVQEGRVPSRAELLARHPDLAAELTAFFADHDQMQRMVESMRPAAAQADGGSVMATGLEPAETPTTGAADGSSQSGGLGRIRYFGDYELLEELARGGMGVVYKARQASLNRLVAIKMILAGQLASEADVQRFHAEAEAAANLDHPHVVPIFEVGIHDRQHYFSMKLIEGGNLAQAMTGKQWSVASRECQRKGAEILMKVARGVHYAHQRRILHRDLKPANILIDADGRPHVTDFGLAKRVEGDSKLTQSGSIVGTPSYMAPEQASGRKGISTAADIYALGAILYELLTGKPPFREETPLDTLVQVMNHEPPRPRSVNPRADRDLETICLKCLEKEPIRRYGSAEALAEDLERWLAGEPILARPGGLAERTLKWARRRPSVATLSAAVLLVSCLGIAGVVWKWRDAVAAEIEADDRAKSEEKAKLAAIEAQQKEAAERKQKEQAVVATTNALAEQTKATQRVLIERDLKEKALLRADGQRISAEASAARHADPALSLLLAIEGAQRVPNHLTFNVLYDALDDLREVHTLTGSLTRAH